jgi:hypothetical protein
VNVHWFAKGFPEEMFARNRDGSLMTAYGSGSLTCPAGPFLKFSTDLAEDLSAYPIDGVFLDGPIASSCYCDACKAEFRRRFGVEMPVAAGPLPLEIRRRLEEFIAEKIGRFVGEFRHSLRAKRPGAVVYHNGASLGRVTWSNRRAVENADFLGIEGGFIGYSPLPPQFLYKTAATGKLLEALAGGKPAVIFNDHAFKRFDYTPLPRPELDLLYAATVATGANPWYLIYYHNRETHAADVAREWNGFIAANRDVFAGTRAAETLALLWSDTTALVSSAAQEEEDSVHGVAGPAASLVGAAKANHPAAFNGAYALLARSGVPFRIVTEVELAEGLEGIDLLVAPSVIALDGESFAGVEKFVERGGTLIADDAFALFDENGTMRDRARLGALLGASPTEEIKRSADNIDYIAFGKGKLFKGIAAAPLPRPTRAFAVERAGGKPLAFFHEPLGGRYDYITPVSRSAAVVENARGSGHAIYLPMNLFEHYCSFAFDEHRTLVMNALRRHHAPIVEVDGLEGRGEVIVRRKPGMLFVHLLNYNGAVRPFARITPLRGVKVLVRCGKPASAKALHSGEQLPIRASKRGQVIRLARLDVAETIAVEIE